MRLPWLMLLAGFSAYAQVNILTANGNNNRGNANLRENVLSPNSVTPSAFGKLGSYQVDGQVYAQPLYASGIAIPALGTRNVLYVATMHASVYAFDADAAPDTAAALWQVSLGTPVPVATLYGSPYADIANEVGILGTGAIDPDRGVLYTVSDTLINGAPAFQLHALDLATGAERLNGPVEIAAQSGAVVFDAVQHLQRPGLLLANGSVYVSFGSHGDQAPWHGWLISYDASDLTHQNGVFLVTPTGNGGSLWLSGRGPAADSQGSIYVITGNGDYDGVSNFSQSFLKLTGAAPAVSNWYTPPDWQAMSDADSDLSAGPALIGGTHIMVGGDKSGQLYVIDGDTMGNTAAPAPTAAKRFAASTGAIFNLAVWDQPGGTALVYAQGSRDSLRSYRVSTTGYSSTPVSSTTAALRFSRIGMTLSANGSDLSSGILWDTDGDYNDNAQPGLLHAFKASDLSVELWNSNMNAARDAMGAVSKFSNPTVANGRVYVGTFPNRVDVYGLLPAAVAALPGIAVVANAASYESDAVSAGEMVSIVGSNLGPAAKVNFTLDENGMVPTSLAGTRVLFDGVPVPVTYTSATQVNAIVPSGLSAASTQIRVEYQGHASATADMAVGGATPGVFSADGTGSGPGMVVNQDGSINSAGKPAPPGSVVTLYATGLGPLSPLAADAVVVTAADLPLTTLPVAASVGGAAAQVTYAGGAPGMVTGVVQVNLRIPDTVAPGSALPLVLQAGGRNSQSGLTVAVGVAAPLVMESKKGGPGGPPQH